MLMTFIYIFCFTEPTLVLYDINQKLFTFFCVLSCIYVNSLVFVQLQLDELHKYKTLHSYTHTLVHEIKNQEFSSAQKSFICVKKSHQQCTTAPPTFYSFPFFLSLSLSLFLAVKVVAFTETFFFRRCLFLFLPVSELFVVCWGN